MMVAGQENGISREGRNWRGPYQNIIIQVGRDPCTLWTLPDTGGLSKGYELIIGQLAERIGARRR